MLCHKQFKNPCTLQSCPSSFCCVLVPHLQNRDNSSTPLHRVIVEISMLRCYGNKGCVILKIEKDVKAESWLVSSLAFCWKRLKQASRAKLHWSFPTETTHRSDMQGLAEGSHEFILGGKKVEVFLLFVEQLVQILHSIAPSQLHTMLSLTSVKILNLLYVYMLPKKVAVKADGSCKRPTFMVNLSKNRKYMAKILNLGKLPNHHPYPWLKAGKAFQGSTLPTPFVVEWFQLLFSILVYFLAPAGTLWFIGPSHP